MNTHPGIVIGVVAVLLLLGVAIWLEYRKRQSLRLQERFGADYGRAVHKLGSRTKAELDLKAREKRVARLDIVPLAAADAQRFTEAWERLQRRFVDNPKGAVAEADELVRELMLKRGYPMADFERRAADISVDHPMVVENYRTAQAIAVRDSHGHADTEELRKAVVHYRALFDELLEVRDAPDANRNAQTAAGRVEASS
jgi:hypothetical protein